jgi:hypothetical protein
VSNIYQKNILPNYFNEFAFEFLNANIFFYLYDNIIDFNLYGRLENTLNQNLN